MTLSHLNDSELMIGSPARRHFYTAFLLTIFIFALTGTVRSAGITWGGGTLTNDIDVLTTGTAVYAYDWANATATVNGVSFTGSSSISGGGANVTIASSTGSIGNNGTAFTSTSTPFSGLTSAYKSILLGADYASSANATFTVTLQNLTIGEVYAVQIWVDDPRSGSTATRTETVTSSGGNSITLAYNFVQSGGGVGQYGIGTFTAMATTQAFTILGAASTQLSALQVRDVTGTGYTPPGPPPTPPVSGATWNGGSTLDSNWSDKTNWSGTQLANNQTLSSGLTFGGTARQLNTNDVTGLTLGSLTFNSASWNITGNPVTLSGAVTASVGGTSIWGLNTTLSATPSITQSASGDILNFTGIISGSGGLTKTAGSTGQGVVNLASTNNSFTGSVSINSGTVGVYSIAAAGVNSSLGAGSGSINLGSSSTSYGGTLNYLGTNSGITARAFTVAANTPTTVESLVNNSPGNAGLEFDGVTTISTPLVLSLSGSSTGTNIFSQSFNNGNIINLSMQVSGPGTWSFGGLIAGTNSLTIGTNTDFTLGYAGYPESILFSSIKVGAGGIFDVSAYDQNSSTFELGYFYSTYGLFQTMTAGHLNGTTGTDINGSLGLYSPGAILNIGGSGAPATLGITGNFIPGSGTINYDLTANGTVGSGSNDLIHVGGNLDLSQGPALITVNAVRGAVQANTPYTLISYGGTLAGDGSGLTVPSPSRTLSDGVVSTATPGLVQVTFAASGQPAANLVWQGNLNNNWDVKTTANWLNGASSDVFYNGDNVIFNDTASQSTVNIPSSLGAGLITISNNTSSYVFSSSVAGYISNGSLTKQGTGTATLGTANTYSGGTVVSSGTLIGGNAAAFGTGTINLGDASTGTNLAVLALNGVTVPNPVIVATNATASNLVLADAGGSSTFSGLVTFPQSLTLSNGIAGGTLFNVGGMVGTGDVILNGGNTSSQFHWQGASPTPTTVNYLMSGNIILTNGAFLDTQGGSIITNTASLIMATNTTFAIALNPTPYNGQVLNALIGSGTVESGPGVTWNLNLTIGAGNGSGTFAGSISNYQSFYIGLIKTGTGTQTLTGNSIGSSGFTTISNGVLAINNTIGSGLGTGAIFVSAGATLAGKGFITSGANTVTNYGVISVGNAGDTTGQIFSLTNTGGMFINAGGALNVDLFSGAGAGDNTATATAADVLNAQCPVTLNAGASLTVSNPNGLTNWLAGDKWKIATWKSAPTNTFTTVNLPALSSGLAWDTSSLYTTGVIGVVSGAPTAPANITSVTVSGGSLIISGTNLNGGQNFHYEVLSSTNVALPLTNWTILSTNSFNVNGTFNYTNAIDPANPAAFFDVKAVQ